MFVRWQFLTLLTLNLLGPLMHQFVDSQLYTDDLDTALNRLPNQHRHFIWLEYIDTIYSDKKQFDLVQLLKSEKFRHSIGVYNVIKNVTIYVTQINIHCSKTILDNALMRHTIEEIRLRKVYRGLYDHFQSGVVINNCDLTCSLASFSTSLIIETRLYFSLCTNWKPIYRIANPLSEKKVSQKKKAEKVLKPEKENTFKPYILKIINMLVALIKFLNFDCIHIVVTPENQGDAIVKFYSHKFHEWLFPCILVETFDDLDGHIMKPIYRNDSYKRGPTLYFLLMSYHRALEYLDIYGNKQFFIKKVPIIFATTFRPMEDGIRNVGLLQKVKRAIIISVRDNLAYKEVIKTVENTTATTTATNITTTNNNNNNPNITTDSTVTKPTHSSTSSINNNGSTNRKKRSGESDTEYHNSKGAAKLVKESGRKVQRLMYRSADDTPSNADNSSNDDRDYNDFDNETNNTNGNIGKINITDLYRKYVPPTMIIFRPKKALNPVKEELRAFLHDIVLACTSGHGDITLNKNDLPDVKLPKLNSSIEMHIMMKPKRKRFKHKYILFARFWMYSKASVIPARLDKNRIMKMWNEYGRGSKDRCDIRGLMCMKHPYRFLEVIQLVIYAVSLICASILAYFLYNVFNYRRLLHSIGQWNISYTGKKSSLISRKKSDVSISSTPFQNSHAMPKKAKSTNQSKNALPGELIFNYVNNSSSDESDDIGQDFSKNCGNDDCGNDADIACDVDCLSLNDLQSRFLPPETIENLVEAEKNKLKLNFDEISCLYTADELTYYAQALHCVKPHRTQEDQANASRSAKQNEGERAAFATAESINRNTNSNIRSRVNYSAEPSNKDLKQSQFTYVTAGNFIPFNISQGKSMAFYQEDEVYLHRIRTSQVWLDAFNVKFLEDMALLKSLNHENLLPFIGICVKKNSVLMLAAKRGSLRDIIRDKCLNQVFNLGLMVSLLIDVAKGMDYLHNSDIGSHGHLRSSKCVVDSRWHCKITGYGLSEIRRRVSQSLKHRGYSMLYIAPELLRTPIHYRSYYGTRKGDIYSFAVILQEVILMGQPYALEIKGKKMSMVNILANVRSKIIQPPFRPGLGDRCPKEWRMLVNNCWSEEPEKRFNFQQILTILRKLAGTDNLTFVERLSQRLEQNVSNLGRMVTDLTAHLESESEKANNLLGCLLPKAVAEDYILGKSYQPKIFRSVTLLCTDIMGFTKISAKSTARETVDFLNALYSSYDAIVKTRDAYKLETIGDAYIVISGCPEKNGDLHASEIAEVALDLFEDLKRHKIPHLPGEEIKSRGGIHSGPIIAGVVGLKVPRFCVFGTTCNIAELMESSSRANMIRISSVSVQLLPPKRFTLSSVEMVALPDKKSYIETYFLLGRKK